MKILEFSFSLGNRKTSCIPSFSVMPILTCAKDAPCQKECYACKTMRLYKNTYRSWLNNYEALIADNGYNNFKIAMNCFLTIYSPKYFRYHVGGDVFSYEYMKAIYEIAKKNKKTKFLLYTKQYNIINNFFDSNKILSNLKIVFSEWLNYKYDNKYNFPIAVYAPNKKEVFKSGFVCGGGCEYGL